MVVTLIGKNYMKKLLLPETPVGSYWLSDSNDGTEKKLFNIEGDGQNWIVKTSDYIKLINSQSIKIEREIVTVSEYAKKENMILNQVTLQEYGIYACLLRDFKELCIIVVSPGYESNIEKYDLVNAKQVNIGKSGANQIVVNHPLVQDVHASLFFQNGKWYIKNLDPRYGTFLNGKPVLNIVELGDLNNIYIMGLKIVMFGTTLFINNLQGQVSIKTNYFIKNENKVDETKFKDDIENIYESENDKNTKYFFRVPRITEKIERQTVKIDSPPNAQKDEKTPFLIMIASELSMMLMLSVTLMNTISGIQSEKTTIKESIPSFVMAFGMFIAMMVVPTINSKYDSNKKKRQEQKRQFKYRKYIQSKIENIDNIMNSQRAALFKNNISSEECRNILETKGSRLWERKIEDEDFLDVKVGIGDVPLDIDIQYPEEKFTMDNDDLMEILNTVGNKSKILKNAPIVFPFAKKKVSAIINENEEKTEIFFRHLLMQLIALQSYEDLKVVLLLKSDKKKKFEDLKMLPHLWNNQKTVRFYADSQSDMQEISKYLYNELRERIEQNTKNQMEDKQESSLTSPYYLIVTDDFKEIENLKFISDMLRTKTNFGFSLLCLAKDLNELPNECNNFIVLKDTDGELLEAEVSSTNQVPFAFDQVQNYDFKDIAKIIANIPIKFKAQSGTGGMLPATYNFLEMYKVGKVEQLNILERWKSNDTTLSLTAPIGVDEAGMPISLDVHEKFHGPHGLIAGSTGSGKSEFIISYILSMAVNYHPDDVAFVLIDYKGGGLAGAFKKNDIKLPHLVGTITNIDQIGLQRSLDSIQSELRKRQVMFNEARNKTDESTIDIYKYQKLYHDGVVDKPIPHLLIICDEFAELKQQQPDFMDELISVARIGRSLGVHLILATQKPSGIVNDQIRSNSKFGICLKVQEKADSMDVIKRPDAANLKNQGQFYLAVGNDEYFVLGQSAYTGAPYVPSDEVQKKIDTSIEFVSDIGTVVKKIDDYVQKVDNSQGDQITNIVKYLDSTAKQENIEAENLWLENIPDTIYVKDVKEKYNVVDNEKEINPTIGEYDDPYNQKQGVVYLPLSKDGNAIIYGNAESGKETLLNTIIYDTVTSHTPDECNIYILDFGTEALKIFKGTPHVGDVVLINEAEKVARLFDLLKAEVEKRKKVLSDYNGDYQRYLKTATEPMPMIVVVLNNFEAFSETYLDQLEDDLQMLTREGTRYGINFIFTVSSYSALRFRLAQNFRKSIALQLNDEDQYVTIFEKARKKRPSHIFGRGLVQVHDDVYEFQTAKICDGEEWNEVIKETIDGLKQKYKETAPKIPILPEVLELDEIKEEISDVTKFVLGLSKKTIKTYTYNLKKNLITMITGNNLEDAIEYETQLLEELKLMQNVNVTVLDGEGVLGTTKKDLIENYKQILENVGSNDKSKQEVIVIMGIDKLLLDLSEEQIRFIELLQQVEREGNYSFIIADGANKIKNRAFDEWYKTYITGDTGIWVGSGVTDQYIIKSNLRSSEAENSCGNSFGYAIVDNQPQLIKLLGIRPKGEYDE